MTDTIYNVTLFGIKMKINRVAFTIPIGDGWDIYWYGILIALGFFLAMVYANKNASRLNLDFNKLFDAIIVAIPVSILFARGYYLIFDQKSLKNFWAIHDGGLAIYGGIIGAVVAALVMCKIKKIKFLDAMDLTVIGFFIGQAIGRWGNFFNQEAFGGPTGSSFWGMTSENIEYELGTGVLAHPCFLYESVWCIIGFFILNHFSKKRKFSGELTLMYCAWYGIGRAVIEQFRTDSLYLGEVKVSQLLSVIICIAAAIVLVIKHINIKKAEAAPEYIPQFSANNHTDKTPNEQGENNANNTEKENEENADN